MPKFHLLAAVLFCARLSADTVFEVRNAEGRSITIELLALEGDNVVFTLASDKRKEHTLGLDKFDEASRTTIQEKSKSLRPRLPKLGIEVVVSRRREKDGYFMVNQTVTAKVKIKNTSLQAAYPKSKATLIYIGRDREHPNQFQVMAKRSFDLQVPINQTVEHDVPGVKTRYDSDNKGTGNIGGYEYEGYVFVITDEAGNVLETKTADAGISKVLQQDSSTATRLLEVKDKTILDRNLEKMDPHLVL